MNAVVVACIVLVVTGAGIALRWGGLPVATPWAAIAEDEVSVGERARRALWFADVLMIGAIATGLLVIGPGGRLVMRLLAVTAGDAAQGKITEADEVVGAITVGGTMFFVLFVGLFGGLLVATSYAVLRKWLPAGRLGMLALGALTGLAFATRIDPLRPDNPDFHIVGPGWVAVVAFTAVGALTVLTFGAVAGRVAGSLPLIAARPGAVAAYAPLVLLLASPFAAAPALIACGVGFVLLGRPGFRRLWGQRSVVVAGRVVIGVAAAALLPAFVADLAEIL